MGRGLKHLIETVQTLQEEGIELRRLNESLDTATATGKLLFHIVASFARFERDNIVENTRAGPDAPRSRGATGGCPKKLDAKKADIARELRKDRDRTVKEICAVSKISRATFYNLK